MYGVLCKAVLLNGSVLNGSLLNGSIHLTYVFKPMQVVAVEKVSQFPKPPIEKFRFAPERHVLSFIYPAKITRYHRSLPSMLFSLRHLIHKMWEELYVAVAK